MASNKAPIEAPQGIKTNTRMLKVITVAEKGEQTAPTPRYFEIAHHAQRTELVKMISWAARTDRTLVLTTVYVE